MRAKDILKEKGGHILAITPQAALPAVARLMYENMIGATVVSTPNGRMLGLLSERDIVRIVGEAPEQVTQMKAEDIFTKNVTTCTPETSLDEVMNIMSEKHFRHMPVEEHGALLGIISIGDVFRHLLHQASESEDALLWAGTTDLL